MADAERRPWTFLSNHARVLILISQNPNIGGRDVASITRRSTQRIIAELEDGGYLTNERIGRRNHYKVTSTAPLHHPHEQDGEIGLLLDLFGNAQGTYQAINATLQIGSDRNDSAPGVLWHVVSRDFRRVRFMKASCVRHCLLMFICDIAYMFKKGTTS